MKVRYRVAGPTIKAFHESIERRKGIRGPIGSGKSVACGFDNVFSAIRQPPNPEKWRYTRYLIARNSYRQLESTTIKTWMEWFGDLGTLIMQPYPHQLCEFPLDDGTWVSMDIWFMSFDNPDKAIQDLKSLEISGAWINEASEMPYDVVQKIDSRVGRYPSRKLYWETPDDQPVLAEPKLVMDTNSPSSVSWWYLMAVKSRPQGWAFFDQPPAIMQDDEGNWIIHPECENVAGQPLGARYWLDQISGKTRQWIDVFLRNQYGAAGTDRVVYPEFRQYRHVAKEPLATLENVPLRIAFDFGRTPACVFGQLSPRGQVRLLRELVTDDPFNVDDPHPKMGIRQFANEVVKPFVKNHFHGAKLIVTGDPSGVNKEGDDRAAFDYVREAGFPITGAWTNDFTPRREVVSKFLMLDLEGEPGLVLDPHNLPVVLSGFVEKYRYRKMQVIGDPMYQEEPMKNAWSHPADAVQYLCLDCDTMQQSEARMKKREQGNFRSRRARSGRYAWRM